MTITWDVENRVVSVTDGVNTSTFVYDGNGNRVKKTGQELERHRIYDPSGEVVHEHYRVK